MGIDPGLALTGWAVIKKLDKPKLISYGCVETKKDKKQEERLRQIYEEIKKLIKEYKPEVVCMEKLFFNTNAKTALAVGEARGVIKVCAALKKIPLTEFTPLQIKSCLTGYGRADKNQIQQMIKSLLNLKEVPKSDDAADAVATALTYCYYNQSLGGLI